MPEISETLLEETSELLDELMPIMQRSIDALQQDPNPLLQHLIDMQHLIGQEIERQEGLLQQVKEMKEKIHNHLNPPEPVPEQDESERVLYPKSSMRGNRSGTGSLRVTMPDGAKIHCRYVIDTFVEVIRKLGIERVESLGIECGKYPLIETNEMNNSGWRFCDGYYVRHIRDTNKKIAILNKIADRLDVSLKIDDLRDELRPFHTSVRRGV